MCANQTRKPASSPQTEYEPQLQAQLKESVKSYDRQVEARFKSERARISVGKQNERDLPTLLERVNEVPQEPGCYLWKDAAESILYVGKAKNLRARMKQYVLGTDEREKIPLMMAQVVTFEYLVVTSEYESLILEKNLIQHYHPPFNVDYRDDKSYPYLAITWSDTYPAIKYTREKHRKGTHYFGPYTDSRAARDTIDIVRRVIPICSAACAEHKRLCRWIERNSDQAELVQMVMQSQGRLCFDASVQKAPGACAGLIDPETYREQVKRVERFLSGRRSEVIGEIEARMQEAAADLDFERAARERDKLATIERLHDAQQVVFKSAVDLDLIGIYREETITGVHVFVVREGRVIIGNEFILDKGMDTDEIELIETFIKRYYDNITDLPREILVPCELADRELLEQWLGQKAGRQVGIRVPQRGDKKRLLELAHTNAKHSLMRFKVKTRYDDERTNQALIELESALALERAPLRIECFDISTIHGSYNVASMVVFTSGKADKQQYRRFKIKLETQEANDFAMMSEVLARRFSPERMADTIFGSKPDLIIVDGGKPQLTAALAQLKALGIDDIAVAGLAKSDEELFVEWSPDAPVVLPTGSASLYLVKRVRDEAHRFAISFHRELRSKGMTQSILDGIAGVGPKRKRIIWNHFKSVKRLLAASEEEIAALKGITPEIAREVKAVCEQWRQQREKTLY